LIAIPDVDNSLKDDVTETTAAQGKLFVQKEKYLAEKI